MTDVGAYEAKTHLARLLDEVMQGKSVTITRHGQPVAKLVPPDRVQAAPADVIDALRAERSGVRIGRYSVRKMIDEGRR